VATPGSPRDLDGPRDGWTGDSHCPAVLCRARHKGYSLQRWVKWFRYVKGPLRRTPRACPLTGNSTGIRQISERNPIFRPFYFGLATLGALNGHQGSWGLREGQEVFLAELAQEEKTRELKLVCRSRVGRAGVRAGGRAELGRVGRWKMLFASSLSLLTLQTSGFLFLAH